MDPVEIEALLIRHQAAMSVVKERSGIGLLADVLVPSDAFYRASMLEAERRGPSKMAMKLAREDAEPERQPPDDGYAPRTPAPAQSFSLDDLLVSLR